MPNNTLTYWDADGVSLHTYARSIETLGGMGPPPLRGENIVIPLRVGKRWVSKTPDSNRITLAMWIRGIAEHATNVDGQPTAAQYQSNYRDLVRQLYKPGKLVQLTKRFYDGGVLRTAMAEAEYVGGIQPSMIGKTLGRCTVDLDLPRSFFYNTTELTHNLVNGDQTINILGDAPTQRIFVTINGARTGAKIWNKTNGVQFTYNRAIVSGQNAVVDVDNFLVTDTSTPAVDQAPAILHDGAAEWLELLPGDNVINVSSSAGTGTIQLRYRAAWV